MIHVINEPDGVRVCVDGAGRDIVLEVVTAAICCACNTSRADDAAAYYDVRDLIAQLISTTSYDDAIQICGEVNLPTAPTDVQ